MKAGWTLQLRATLAVVAGCVAVGVPVGVFADVAEPPAEEGLGDAEPLAEAKAVVADNGNPYRAIVVRNAFRLKEPLPAPPPPTNAPPPPEQPKVDVKLAGLSEIRGVRYAYLVVPDTDRPGQFHYPTLTDDPARGDTRHKSGVDIREINLKTQSVRLVNGGIEATINFKDNGVKNMPVAAPAKPGAPGQPGAVLPRPTVTGVNAPPAPGAAAAPISSEAIVFSRNPNRASAGMNPNAPAPVPMINGVPASVLAPSPVSDVVVPSRPVRTGGAGGSASVNTPAQPQITLEQEYQALIRQRQVADQQGIQLPPIPGLPLPTDPNPH